MKTATATATQKIIDFFKDNEIIFNSCIEALDSYNGYLGDDRYYYMEDLNDFYSGVDPIDLLNRAFFGRDDEYYFYTHAWSDDGQRAEIASAAGVDPADVVLYAFDGYEKTPVYREVSA